MEHDLGDYRKSYDKGRLDESTVPENPLQLFQSWFYEVDRAFPEDEANAMTLSTIERDGFPKGRVVLLKKFTYEGFIFYTNYNSAKARAIAETPEVCLSFFWHKAERQVIVKGRAEKIAPNLSDGYFESRPRGSQLGAIVSPQSEVIESRDVLDNALQRLDEATTGQALQRPEHWGGYLVRPLQIEFWQGRANRLHDRIRYSLTPDFDWTIERLAP